MANTLLQSFFIQETLVSCVTDTIHTFKHEFTARKKILTQLQLKMGT